MRQSLAIIFVLCTLLFFSGCVVPQVDNKIKISDRGLATSLPIYIGIQKGFFEEEGVDVELLKVTSGNEVFNALLRSEIDVGELPIDPLILGGAQSETGVSVFLLGEFSNMSNREFDALVVSPGSSIRSLSDLTSKKIGVFPGVTAKTFLAHYLKQKSVDISEIEFIELPPTTQLQALSAGSIDALLTYQPTTTIAKSSGYVPIDEGIFNKLGFSYYSVYAFSPTFSKSPLSNKVQAAFVRATNYMKENPSEARKILADNTTLGNLANEMSYFPDYRAATAEDADDIKILIKFYENSGTISSSTGSKVEIYTP